jgi:DNA-binding transcriptional LysR family regulator
MSIRDRLPFELWTLHVFLTVCEKKSMAHAATTLGLTQPAVSLIVQDMERQLGVELFDRSIRPISLTPAGTVLRQSAGILVAEALKIAPLVQRCRRGFLPTIRVGLVYSVQRLLGVPLVKALSDVADNVIVLSGITSVHAAALLTRELDVCIGVDDLLTEVGLDFWPIVKEPYVLVAPRDIATIDLKILAESHPFISYSTRSIDGPKIERYLHRHGLSTQRTAEFDTPLGLTEAIAAGLGWAISTPLCLIEAGVPLNVLSVHPLPRLGFTRTITLICRHKELGKTPAQAVSVSTQAAHDRCASTFVGSLSWVLQEMQFGSKARDR